MARNKSARPAQFRPNQVNSKITVKIKTASAVATTCSDLERGSTTLLSDWATSRPVPKRGLIRALQSRPMPAAQAKAQKWMTAVSLHASISAAQSPASAAGKRDFFFQRAPAGSNQAERGGDKQGFVDEIAAVINGQGSEGEQQRGDQARERFSDDKEGGAVPVLR